MEKLANLTQTDINNGVLIRMLANAGIPNVQEYVKTFHQETEELIVEKFEQSNQNKADNDEQILPPINIQSWITGLRPHLDDPIQPPLLQQEQQKQPPTDLKSWMQYMAPDNSQPPIDNISSQMISTSNDDHDDAAAGNVGIWLNNWSKTLTERPPPASLDSWLKGLIPNDMNEPISKTTTPKGRLNSYLNAAQQVLSQRGYDVSNEVSLPTDVKSKVGMFGNVKQMYFLWKTLDKNHDRKITVEDIQIMLQEMGLGFLSKYVGQTLFDMVDTNHDGELQFRDFVALMSIIKQLISAVGSAKTKP